MDFISGPVVGFLPWLMRGIDVLGSVAEGRGALVPWREWAERLGRPQIETGTKLPRFGRV